MQRATGALPDRSAIEAARERLRPILVPTPLLPFDAGTGDPVLLKCENLQRTGSFKIRGAYNRIASLTPEERAGGVVAYSSGNHAQGVACAAGLLGVRATVVMPEDAVPAKVEATRRYGAEVVFAGRDSETRRRFAEELVERQGGALVPPYDHAQIIAGQATLGLEILEGAPDVRTIVVPIGGGGLIAGIALAVKGARPGVRIVGAEPEGAADAAASRREGRLVELASTTTIADGLRARRVGDLPFAAISAHVDEIVTVGDPAILEAVRLLLYRAHLVVEPSGAVSLAAALAGATRGPTVVVLSGGNISPDVLGALMQTAGAS